MDLNALLKNKIDSPSTQDEREFNDELSKIQTAVDRPNGTNENDKRNSFSEKSEAKKRFEYYQSRREDLKATISKLLSLAENLNDTSIVNSLRNALTQRNNYKEFAIANALEQLVAEKDNSDKTNNSNGGAPVKPNGSNELSNFLEILSKFVGAGGHLFPPTVCNQINPYHPSKNSQTDTNLNEQLRELLKKLNKRIDSLNKEAYNDWSEWFDWFDG